MKRATKWLAFTVIMTMVAAALLVVPASAMAQTTTSTTMTGKIEMVVWSDLNGNGVWDHQYDELTGPENELIDGIEVVLSKEVQDASTGVNTWEFVDKKKTGPASLLNNPVWDYKHGCVVWDNLTLDGNGVWPPTRYKLDLVMDGTFKPVGDGYCIAELSFVNNDIQLVLPMVSWNELWNAPQINETTATISGFVWNDANCDQIIEWSEYSYFPLQGWTVMLTNSRGSKIATTVTDVHGYYYFRGLKPGTYEVWVQDRRSYNQVAPYYKFYTWPPWGYNKGHFNINATGNNRYRMNNFGMLDMRDSVWAPLYYALWWIGLLQYQFKW
jgi:SdrD B-like domain